MSAVDGSALVVYQGAPHGGSRRRLDGGRRWRASWQIRRRRLQGVSQHDLKMRKWSVKAARERQVAI